MKKLDIIRDLNKRSLAEQTGISYSRLRKYAAKQITSLTEEEIEMIYKYLSNLASVFCKED